MTAPNGKPALLVGSHPAPVEGRTVDLALYNDAADLIADRDRARDIAVVLEQQNAAALHVLGVPPTCGSTLCRNDRDRARRALGVEL